MCLHTSVPVVIHYNLSRDGAVGMPISGCTMWNTATTHLNIKQRVKNVSLRDECYRPSFLRHEILSLKARVVGQIRPRRIDRFTH